MEEQFETISMGFVIGRLHLREDITLDKFLSISNKVVDQAIDTIDGALDKAGLQTSDIDLVILAGGSSQLPKVSEKIYEKIGIEPNVIPKDLMMAVSYGAALYQRDIYNLPQSEASQKILGDSLAIEVNDNGHRCNKLLLNYNAKLPASEQYTLPLMAGQDEVIINLVTLDGTTDITNKRLNQKKLKLSSDATKIIVTINVDTNKIITVTAKDPNDPKNIVELRVDKNVLSDQQLTDTRARLGIVINDVVLETNTTLQPCIGIDLGTTTSELSFVNRAGEIEFGCLENKEPAGDYDKNSFPSTVFFRDGTRDVVACSIENKNVRETHGRFFDKFKTKDWNKSLETVSGIPITPERLTTYVLNKIWKTAIEDLKGYNLESAVVTVPAGFDSDQCQQVINAAHLAGINNVSLIDEPTAAFLYYKSLHDINTKDIKNVLVFDFGGGTTDVAILDVSSNKTSQHNDVKDSIYRILATNSNTNCGGQDVDRELCKYVEGQFKKKNKKDFPKFKESILMAKVESAKIALSTMYSANN